MRGKVSANALTCEQNSWPVPKTQCCMHAPLVLLHLKPYKSGSEDTMATHRWLFLAAIPTMEQSL